MKQFAVRGDLSIHKKVENQREIKSVVDGKVVSESRKSQVMVKGKVSAQVSEAGPMSLGYNVQEFLAKYT